jgi:hypothetical protein
MEIEFYKAKGLTNYRLANVDFLRKIILINSFNSFLGTFPLITHLKPCLCISKIPRQEQKEAGYFTGSYHPNPTANEEPLTKKAKKRATRARVYA